ncbi:hypothetical protein [Terrimonas ferruginea]|uniref:hypothetical protein n=1 Tax=Terrimonas ferruginea TaxID=249 RepID=UPI0004195C0E|nr:hypothetical protein [Terrimonas ferruginea]
MKIPVQYKGSSSDTEFSIRCQSVAEAAKLYAVARGKLLNVNLWEQYAGGGAIFRLHDTDGHRYPGNARKHLYIAIDIPATPGPEAGQGQEWVKIESIDTQEAPGYQYTVLTVRPVSPHFISGGSTAHFFTSAATSSFIVLQENNKVIARVSGRNETPNTGAKAMLDKIRNFVLGLLAMAGMNKPQWRKLVKGLLSTEKE